MGNSSLTGSSNRTAMSRPALAPCACSAGFFIVPKGPPVLEDTSNVPAECHLRNQNENPDQATKTSPNDPEARTRAGLGRVETRERIYARRSMRGAQLFSAMRARSLRLAFSTASWYSALTVG